MRILALIVVACSAFAQSDETAARWKTIEFLLGEWVGDGDGAPGKGTGEFSFRPELNGRIVVRRSFNQMGNARHEDLMVLYLDGASMRAGYWDSEGHMIPYKVTVAGRSAVFESEGGTGPRYRLTYTRTGANLEGLFQVAPPGGEFKSYLNWISRPKR
ncbi:MAG: hypothetical protein HY820_05105 [Acidobacteria bacterium]|nr:hypothetical protein [Acidobacteriota bacterium]